MTPLSHQEGKGLPLLPPPGSMGAHDALIDAFLDHDALERVYDLNPTPERAAEADMAWNAVVAHAANCGMSLAEPSVKAWVGRRIETYARECLGRIARLAPVTHEGAH